MKRRMPTLIILTLMMLITSSCLCNVNEWFDAAFHGKPTKTNKPGIIVPTKVRISATATTEGMLSPTATYPPTKPLEVEKPNIMTLQAEPNKIYCHATIHNPNKEYWINEYYKCTLLGANDQVLGEGNNPIWIGPEQKAEFVVEITVPDASRVTNAKITHIMTRDVARVNPGENRVTAAKTLYQQGYDSPIVTGEVTSTFQQDVGAPVYTAAAYDAAGDMIGIGQTIGTRLPAGGTVPVEVPIKLNQEPDRVELHFTPESGTALETSPDLKLEVETAEFIPPTEGYGYTGGIGVILHNPDPERIALTVYYTAAAYDAQGNVLAVCFEDQLAGVLFAGERMGFGCFLRLPPGAIPARVEVIPIVGEADAPWSDIRQNPLTVENIQINGGVTATIRNKLSRELKSTYVLAVGYDAEGRMAGHGFYPLETVAANESREIEIGFYRGSAVIERVEVFPVISFASLR